MNPERELESLERQLATLRARFEAAEDMTAQVLAVAQAHGVDRIGINRCDKTVHETGNWPFAENGNLFAKGRQNGWPVVWQVAEDAGISAGCGNGDQHQISMSARLIDGIYELRDGRWLRVDEAQARAS